MGAAHFTIEGKFLMDTARNIVLGEDPGRAWRLLADSLIGEGADAVIRQVLAGEVDLAGDSDEGVSVEPAGDDAADYVKDLRYIYAGRVRLDGAWYQPCAVVLAYGPADAKSAGRVPVGDDGLSALTAWARRRAQFYADTGERVECVSGTGNPELDNHYIVFEPCGEPPHWFTPCRTARDAVREAVAVGRRLERRGYGENSLPRIEAEHLIREHDIDKDEADETRRLAHEAEDAAWQQQLAEIADKVREQAGADVFPMTLQDGRVVQVPRAPFMHWALCRPGMKRVALPPWQPVAESGMKMCNDNPYHTDWVLGAGLTIAEGYDENVTDPAWGIAIDMQIAEADRD